MERWRGAFAGLHPVPLLYGVLVSVATYGAVAWVAPGMFASGGGLVAVSVLAHAVGTAVALGLDSDSRRNAGRVFGVVTVASVCGLLMLATIASTYAALAYAAPRLFASTSGLVACCGAGYLASAYVGGRLYPGWNRHSGPIALVVLALAATYASVVLRWAA